MKQTIGIDCRLAGIEHAGIGRYIEELVRHLTQNTSITWVLFFQKEKQLPWLMESDHIRIVVTPIRHYTIEEQVVMPSVFLREKLDLLHVPHFNVPLFYNKPFVVTIHDLLWHDQRGENMTTLSPLIYSAKYRAYKLVSSKAISRAQQVLVPATTVKETITSHMSGIDAKKIVVTYEGVDEFWFQTDTKRAPIQDSEKILFYTGSLYPHKNVMLVVRSLKELPAYHLYISSSRNVFVDKFMKEVEQEGMSERVTHLGRLSDEELRFWYHRSTALVQPSLSEGFGLTGVEALAAGLPLLASNIPIFTEIYKNTCISFDPMYPASFVEAVHVLEGKDRTKMILKGKKQAKEYSWEKMAQQTLEVYQTALRSK